MRALIITLLAMLLGGCAASNDSTSQSVASERSDLVCTYEQVSGSHMRQRVCRTQEQIEADREAARRYRDLDDMETSANDVRSVER